MLHVRTSRFAADGDLTGGVVLVRLMGEADAVSLEDFTDLLVRLRGLTRAVDVSEVAIDFRRLEWLTARCIAGLVDWIAEARASGRGFKIRFVSNPAIRWQRRTLAALQACAPDTIAVE